jgi:hypothetical protein
MENGVFSDSTPGDADADAVKIQAHESISETAELTPPLDSSTPLLAGLQRERDADPEAQQTSTVVSELNSPPMAWEDWGYVAVIVIAILAAMCVSGALKEFDLDPLNFTTLTWYSITTSFLSTMACVRGSLSGSVSFEPRPPYKPNES